jgi:hypothetical protein
MAINFQTLKQLFEQEIGQVQGQAAPEASQSQPAAQPAAQPPQQVQQNPQSQTSGNPVTVDKIVDHLNGIRSGKSFNDPLVFTAITNVFNSLSAAEKAVLDKALSQIDNSITQITKQQSPPNPNNQEVKAPSVKPEIGALAGGASAPNSFQGPQQVQQAMQSSPISGMMAGLISETFESDTSSLSSIVESLNRPIKTSLVVNGKEVEFGSPEHITQITIVLNGLEDFKNCYKKGSSMRYTISNACGRIRKFLKDVEKRSDKTTAEATQEEELY